MTVVILGYGARVQLHLPHCGAQLVPGQEDPPGLQGLEGVVVNTHDGVFLKTLLL